MNDSVAVTISISWTLCLVLLPFKEKEYNKGFNWLLSLVGGRENINPWNFLSSRSVFVVHESLGSHWVYAKEIRWHRMGALIIRKTNHGIRSLELWASPTSRKGRWMEVELNKVANAQSCLWNETPIKTLDIEAQWSFLVGEHFDVPGWWHALFHGDWAWKLCIWHPLRPFPTCLSVPELYAW